MESKIKTTRLMIGGMTCISCQNLIENKLRNTAGVIRAEVSYSKGSADIAYDTDTISLKDIKEIIFKLNYTVLTGNEQKKPSTIRMIGILVIILSLYALLQEFGILNMLVPGQLAKANMSYGMLFVIGLITSVHCVAMCGGINISQCITRGVDKPQKGNATLRPTFLYNLGRVISYTLIGFVVGAIGSTVTFSNTLQGVLKIAASIFMVIMGVNMLGFFPWLRKITPRMPKFLASKVNKTKSGSKNPLFAGLLNGLMPCGPLQAMQIYALSTGSPFMGALSMFLFSLGTVPLMFSLGALSSILSKKFTHKIMTAGAVLVIVLGLSMFSQGLSLSGFAFSSNTDKNTINVQSSESGNNTGNGVQVIESDLSTSKYPDITVTAGVPVKWIINAPKGSINGCNNKMILQEYGIEYEFKAGENIIEFTPSETGKFRYTCWMGMINGTITVT